MSRWLIALLLASPACAQSPAPPAKKEVRPVTDSIAAALSLVQTRAWTRWQGLPVLTLAALRQHLPDLPEAFGLGTLGQTPTRAAFRRIALPGHDRPAVIWSRGEVVLALEVAYPGEPAAFAGLPEPALRLDHSSGTVIYPASADVYPDRGLAVHYTANREGVVRVVLFAPTTAATYRDTLHPHAQAARRLPRRR